MHENETNNLLKSNEMNKNLQNETRALKRIERKNTWCIELQTHKAISKEGQNLLISFVAIAAHALDNHIN
jgi:hypothetical protein